MNRNKGANLTCNNYGWRYACPIIDRAEGADIKIKRLRKHYAIDCTISQHKVFCVPLAKPCESQVAGAQILFRSTPVVNLNEDQFKGKLCKILQNIIL